MQVGGPVVGMEWKVGIRVWYMVPDVIMVGETVRPAVAARGCGGVGHFHSSGEICP